MLSHIYSPQQFTSPYSISCEYRSQLLSLKRTHRTIRLGKLIKHYKILVTLPSFFLSNFKSIFLKIIDNRSECKYEEFNTKIRTCARETDN